MEYQVNQRLHSAYNSYICLAILAVAPDGHNGGSSLPLPSQLHAVYSIPANDLDTLKATWLECNSETN